MILDPYRFGSGSPTKAPGVGSIALAGVAPTFEIADPDGSNVVLLLHLNGSDGDTTTTDSSGLNKVVTITASHGAAIKTAAAKFGATGFKGVTSSSDIGGSMLATLGSEGVFAGDFTIEWFADPQGSNQVMAYFAGGAYVYANFLNNYDGASGTLALSTTYSGYKHVAISRRSGTLYVFLDGVLSSSVSYSGSFNASTIEWGRFVPNNNLYMTGYIDEVRVTAGVGRYVANFSVPTVPFLDPTSRAFSIPAGSISLTGRAPAAARNTSISPPTGAITTAGNAPVTGPLSTFQANLWAAYGITLQLSTYAGSAIRVRKSTGGDTTTEQDIGFVGSALDTTALATFAGSETVVITKFYDQSGNGRDFVQATGANQPRITNAGVYDGFVRFDASNDELLTSATTGTGSVFSVAGKMTFRQNTPTQVMYAAGTGAGGQTIAQVYVPSGANQIDVYIANTAASAGDRTFTSGVSFPVGPEVIGSVHALGAGSAALACRLYRAGSEITGASGGNPTGSYTAQTWRLGSGGGANYANLNVYSFAIWESNQAANMAAIATAMA